MLTVGLGVLFASCAAGDEAGSEGGAGKGTMGNAGDESGAANAGTPPDGSAGDDQGGASSRGQGGSSGGSQDGTGAGQDGSAGDGDAAGGGRDDGEGTVTGVVRTSFGGPNENVLIAIGSATTMTDEDGRFEIPNVPPEYDLVLIATAESYALVIPGISERTLSLRAPGFGSLHAATISGVVTGGAGTPIPADCFARAAFQGSSIEVMGVFGVDTPLTVDDASYTIDLFWYGSPASVAGFLYALEYRRDERARTISYDGFGSKPFGISDRGSYGLPDGSIPATTIELAPVASRTVSGSVTVPPGYVPRLEFHVGPFPTDIILEPEGTYSNLLPTGLAGIQNVVWLNARNVQSDIEATNATYLIDDAVTTLHLSTPEAPPVSILPATEALGVGFDTEFSWEPPADSISTLYLSLGQWTVVVVTNGSSATIPDLTAYGASYAPGGAGSWFVSSQIGLTSIDEWMRLTADPAAYLNDHGKIETASGSLRTFNLAN
jgi:hypothetical protein